MEMADKIIAGENRTGERMEEPQHDEVIPPQ